MSHYLLPQRRADTGSIASQFEMEFDLVPPATLHLSQVVRFRLAQTLVSIPEQSTRNLKSIN